MARAILKGKIVCNGLWSNLCVALGSARRPGTVRIAGSPRTGRTVWPAERPISKSAERIARELWPTDVATSRSTRKASRVSIGHHGHVPAPAVAADS